MKRVEISVVIILCLLFLLHAYHHSGYTEEDAFISFQYARNLASGNGLVFNPGEKVEGYTNFLWTVLMSLAFPVGWDINLWAKFLGGMAALATVLLLCITRFKPDGEPPWIGFLASLYLITSPGYVLWSVGGLETALFCLLITAACLTVTSLPQTSRFGITAGILLGLAGLTRPEGLLVAATVAGATLLHPGTFRKKITGLAALLIPVLIMVIPHFIWRLSYYGYLLPNTFYAKVGGGSHQVFRGLTYLNLWAEELMYIPVAGLMWVLLHPRSGRRRRTIAAVTVVYLLYIVLIGGDWMRAGRFIVPVMPFTGLAVFWMVSDLLLLTRFKVISRVSAAILSILFVIGQLSSAAGRWKNTGPWSLNTYWTSAPVLQGLWLKRFAPDNSSLATGALGHVTYYSELVVYDRLGLIDPHIAHQAIRNMGEGDAGHEKQNLDYILSKEPTFMFGNDRLIDFQKSGDDRTRSQRDQDRETEYRNKNNSISIANHPEVRRKYRTIRVVLAGKSVQFQILKGKLPRLKEGAVFQALPH